MLEHQPATAPTTDGERVNRLFESIAILHGLEAYAASEEDGQGVLTACQQMSRTVRKIMCEVIDTMNP